jgi:hypothetical protein
VETEREVTMNPIAKLFSRTPSASDIREHLKQLELDQKKQRRDLIMLEQKKQEKVNTSIHNLICNNCTWETCPKPLP